MKSHKCTVVVIWSLFLVIEGGNITERFVQEGETFIFHLPSVRSDTSNIKSFEWNLDRNKLLAIVSPVHPNNSVIFGQINRINFMQNGSIIIQDVKQEDTGNYTCKIVFKNGQIWTHTIWLTLYRERTEQNQTRNSTSASSGVAVVYILQTAIPAFGALFLIVSVIIIIFKCRRKSFTQEEHIYSNTINKRKQTPRTCDKTATCSRKLNT